MEKHIKLILVIVMTVCTIVLADDSYEFCPKYCPRNINYVCGYSENKQPKYQKFLNKCHLSVAKYCNGEKLEEVEMSNCNGKFQ